MRSSVKYAAMAALALGISAWAQNASVLFPKESDAGVVLETNVHLIRIVTIADNLEHPWGLTVLPDGGMLVTEQPGRLRLIRNGVLQPQPIPGTPEVRFVRHGGLWDVALHPDFATNHWIYMAYAKAGARGATVAVMRARFDGKQLTEGRDIFIADAWSDTDLNFGCRLLFGRDGMLYISVGDRDERERAQNPGDHAGKVLRLKDDGTVPNDNPFVGRPGFKPEIYSYGHRNPQGLTINPQTGAIWESEHGPLGGDEVNIIQPGKNYGWPVVTYGREYNGDPITDQPVRAGMEPPRFYWVPSIGISGITFYTGNRFPGWKGFLFVSGLSGMMLQRVRLQGEGTAERESMLTPLRERVRDVRQGLDGLLYVVIDGEYSRPEDSGKVLRIQPSD